MLNNVGQSDASSCVSALPGGAPNLIPLATSGSSTTIPGGSCVVMEVLQSEDLLRIPLVRKMIQEHLRLLDMQLSWRMECFRLRDENAQLRGHSHPSNMCVF